MKRPGMLLGTFATIAFALIFHGCSAEAPQVHAATLGGPAAAVEPTAAPDPQPVDTLALDPCQLLTADDIRLATGVKPGPAKWRADSLNSCIWSSSDATQRQLVYLLVARSSVRTYDEFTKAAFTLPQQMPRVDGAGLFGVWTGFALQAYTGSHMVQVNVGTKAGSRSPEQARQLVQIALSRMPQQ